MMLTARALLDTQAGDDPLTDDEIREAISGQICRCTGYATIVRSIRWAAEHPTGGEMNHEGRCAMTAVAALAGWKIGLILGVVVIAVAAVIVIDDRPLAMRIAKQASGAVGGVWRSCEQQTDELDGVARINDSGVRILHSARALRKVAVGR